MTDVIFYINSVAFGVGLAMDAFSVSMANGLSEPHMKRRKMLAIAGVFAAFQIIMPLLGWLCVHTVAESFESFQTFIPYIAIVLLLFIGGKMIYEAVRGKGGGDNMDGAALGAAALFVQGVATSIDALSVGFTIAEYTPVEALVESLIIGAVTFMVCVGGVMIGKRFGTKLGGAASVLGGVILIAIGVEIFVSGVFA